MFRFTLACFYFYFQVYSASAFYENSSYYVPEWNNFLNLQKKLLKDLFDDYDYMVAPVYSKIDATKPIGYNPLAPKRFNYTVYLYNLKLVEVIEPEEKVSVVMEYWYDPRLAWNPSLYGDITILHMRQDKVWSPTINMFKINDLVDFRDQDFRMVAVENTGQVYDSMTLRVSLNCPLNGNSEWDLLNLTNYIDILSYNDGLGDMQLATFEIKIQRNPMYYIYMIVFPSFIINALSIVGVFMKKTDKMSKLNVGLTNIMTMTFILGVMADKIPKTGSIPLLGIYIIINLFIMVIAVGNIVLIGKIQNFAIPRLRNRKTKLRQKLEYILGDPLETICMVILGTLNVFNLLVIIIFWIWDS